MRRVLVCAGFLWVGLLAYSTSRAQLSPPTARSATAVTDTSFAAHWDSDSGANAYYLDVSTSRTFATFLPGYSSLPVLNLSTAVRGLSPGVAYYYRVRATNISSQEVSGNSDTITVITLPGFPLPIPEGVVGGTVVYSRQGSPNDTIWMAAGDGSFDSMVVEGAWPRLSHNGRYIAFHRGSDPNKTRQNLLVRDLETDSETTVFGNYDYLVNYSWTPDDSTLFFDFLCGMQYWHLNAAGTAAYFGVDCYDDAPSARDDSGTLAFHNYNIGIMLVDPGAANRRVVPNTVPHDYWPTWSPDGQWLSFGRPAIDADYPNVVNYFKIRPDGSGLTQLTFLSGADTNKFTPSGAWTSDGKYILAAGYLDGTHGIFAIPTDGSGIIRQVSISQGAPPDFVGTVTPGNTPLAVSEKHTVPVAYELEQNYPNPFNPSTVVSFQLSAVSTVRLVVFDVLGREVETLVDGVRPAGSYRVTWDAARYASGVYFYRLTASETGAGGSSFVSTKRMLLLK